MDQRDVDRQDARKKIAELQGQINQLLPRLEELGLKAKAEIVKQYNHKGAHDYLSLVVYDADPFSRS